MSDAGKQQARGERSRRHQRDDPAPDHSASTEFWTDNPPHQHTPHAVTFES
jgi:hypothetical protein